MEDFQQQRLRRQALSRFLLGTATMLALVFTCHAQHGRPVPIRGTAPTLHLQQTGRTTFLVLSGPVTMKIPLKHEGTYSQGLDVPLAAAKVASGPHFLIFTDSFASNPGNLQGQCGASPTGERYLHIIALGASPHETASALIESCWQNMVPAYPPRWDAATYTVRIDLLSNDNGALKQTFHVSPEGEVTK